jgi:hypothetical protein
LGPIREGGLKSRRLFELGVGDFESLNNHRALTASGVARIRVVGSKKLDSLAHFDDCRRDRSDGLSASLGDAHFARGGAHDCRQGPQLRGQARSELFEFVGVGFERVRDAVLAGRTVHVAQTDGLLSLLGRRLHLGFNAERCNVGYGFLRVILTRRAECLRRRRRRQRRCRRSRLGAGRIGGRVYRSRYIIVIYAKTLLAISIDRHAAFDRRG